MRKTVAYGVYAANLTIVFLLWLTSPETVLNAGPWDTVLSLARLAGLFAASAALTQLILISRVQWVEERLGMDQLTQMHHQNGFLVIAFVVAHPILVTLAHANISEQSILAQLGEFVRHWTGVRLAVGGLLVFVFVITTATVLRKRLKYEQWYFMHISAYVAISLTPFHQFAVGSDITGSPLFRAYWILVYVLAAGGLILYRFVRPLHYLARHRFAVEKVLRETDDVVSLYIGGRTLGRFPIRSGQFMILRFLSGPFWWEAHPFSLSCAPNDQHIRVSIKGVGDFTSRVPSVAPGTQVLVDGPHGALTSRLCAGDKVLMISGGIGITPLRALCEEFVLAGKDIMMICCNRTARDIVFREELATLAQNDSLTVHHVLSRVVQWTGEKGHLDASMIQRLTPALLERECFLCGPVALMEGVTRALVGLGVKRSRIHYERFAL